MDMLAPKTVEDGGVTTVSAEKKTSAPAPGTSPVAPPVAAVTPPGKPLIDWWRLFRPPTKPVKPSTPQRPNVKPPDLGRPGRPDFDGKPGGGWGGGGGNGDHVLRSILRERLKDRIRDRLGGGGRPQPKGGRSNRW